jgi:aminoglycoside phosphotransferase (APT) family kinase protein
MRQARKNPAIPVPEIYFYDHDHDLCDADYFFMEKLSGENYGYVKESLPQSIQAQIDRQIGAIIREVNKHTGTFSVMTEALLCVLIYGERLSS